MPVRVRSAVAVSDPANSEHKADEAARRPAGYPMSSNGPSKGDQQGDVK